MGAPRLSTQAAIMGAGRFLNVVFAAGTLMILARIMPDKESYGAVAQLLMLYMVFSQVFAAGLPQSTYYFLPRYHGGERRGFLVQTIVLLLLSGLLLGVGLYLGANLLGRLLGNRHALPDLLHIFAIYPLFMLPTLAVEGTLLHANRPLTVVIFNTGIRLGMFAALVIPTWLGMSLARTIVIWVAVSAVMGCAATVLMLSTVRGLPLMWRRAMLREEWSFSLPMLGVTVLTISASYLDRFLVSNAMGPAAFAIYSNATIDIPTVSTVVNATSSVLLAEFSRRTSDGGVEAMMPVWHQAMAKTAVLIYASLGFLLFWGHETMRVLFSNRFAESGLIFTIIVCSIPIRLLNLQPVFVALGATRALAGFTAISLLMQSICIPTGGKLFGLPGMAAGAVVGGYLTSGVALYLFCYRLTHIGLRRFLPWSRVGLILLVSLGAGAISRGLFVLSMRQWPLIASFAAGLIVFLVAYFWTLHRLHLLPVELLRSFFRRQRTVPPREQQDEVPSTVANGEEAVE